MLVLYEKYDHIVIEITWRIVRLIFCIILLCVTNRRRRRKKRSSGAIHHQYATALYYFSYIIICNSMFIYCYFPQDTVVHRTHVMYRRHVYVELVFRTFGPGHGRNNLQIYRIPRVSSNGKQNNYIYIFLIIVRRHHGVFIFINRHRATHYNPYRKYNVDPVRRY